MSSLFDSQPSADEAGIPSTANTINVSVSVQLVGVIGGSACGKSTIAHQLAKRLNSPLYPISADSFFLEDVSAELGTYEDYRCIDYGTIAHWMTALVHAVSEVSVRLPDERGVTASWPAEQNCCSHSGAAPLHELCFEKYVQSAWWSQMRPRIQELGKYHRATAESTSPTPVGESGFAASNVSVSAAPDHHGISLTDTIITSASQEDSEGDSVTDASLCAHEAEEERRRERVIEPAQCQQGHGSVPCFFCGLRVATDEESLHPVLASSPHVTIYVVWEGFTLLCNREVNSLIDYGIAVECDLETACLRRFFRTPRRHLAQQAVGNALVDCHSESEGGERERQQRKQSLLARVVRQVYRPRIEQLWSVRSRQRYRVELVDALEREMRLDGLNELASADCVAATSPARTALCDALDLLSPCCFDPPRPHVLRQMTHNDDPRALGGGDMATTPLPTDITDTQTARSTASVAAASSAVTAGKTGDDCATYWSSDGLPEAAFELFWKCEFDDWLAQSSSPSSPHTPGTTAALVWASLRCVGSSSSFENTTRSPQKHQSDSNGSVDATSPTRLAESIDDSGVAYINRVLAERGRLALLQSSARRERAAEPSSAEVPGPKKLVAPATGTDPHSQLSAGGDLREVALSAEAISLALAPFYYEFRYWFFFEVLFFHRVFRPLQAHRLRWRSVAGDHLATPNLTDSGCGVGDDCIATGAPRAVPRPWWTITNDKTVDGVNADRLRDQTDAVSAEICAIR